MPETLRTPSKRSPTASPKQRKVETPSTGGTSHRGTPPTTKRNARCDGGPFDGEQSMMSGESLSSKTNAGRRDSSQPAIVRRHRYLPLLHDFDSVYGDTRGKTIDIDAIITDKPYWWKNSSVQLESLRSNLKKKRYILLGKLPDVKIVQRFVGDAGEAKKFASYVSSVDQRTVSANDAQLQLDLPRAISWITASSRRAIMDIFVSDPTWEGRFPKYVQGMDLMVHAFRIPSSSTNMIAQRRNMMLSLRLMILAVEYVYGEDFDSMSGAVGFLGHRPPMFSGVVPRRAILPLFETMRELISSGNPCTHRTAYNIAYQLRAFNDAQMTETKKSTPLYKKIRSFVYANIKAATPEEYESAKGILGLWLDNADHLVAFRGTRRARR